MVNKFALACVVLFVIIGCMDTRCVRQISPDNLLQGTPAKSMVINIPEDRYLEVSLPVGTARFKIPHGTYEPFVEDDKGIFFKSPQRISCVLTKPNPFGGSNIDVADGGIFIDKARLKAFLWAYSNNYTIVYPEVVPDDTFRLEVKK